MNKITFIMNILRLIFITFIFCISFVQTASANLVLNPFLAGSAAAATNWTSSATGTGSAFNSNTRPVNATITAAGGATEFYSGCVGAACLTFPFVVGTSAGAQQSITTVAGATYKLSYWVYSSAASAPGGAIEIAVYWGNTKVSTAIPAGWSLQTFTLTATAATTNITVLIRDDPAYSAITYIDLEPVVLRLAKTNPANFAIGVPANYTLTVTNISSPAVTSSASFTIRDQLPPNIQYNSAAAGAGVTSVTCAATGTVAAGQLLTCTVDVTGGIAPGGTGSITVNVTPQAAAAGVAGTNKASLEFGATLTSAPSACTGTDIPLIGCAIAASIIPTAAQLTFTKTVTTICDPINGGTLPKNIPGSIVRWTMTIANSGTASVNLATVSDLLNINTTLDPNLITGAGGATGCTIALGTPESSAGRGFKLSIVNGTRPPAAYPKYLTAVADADAATLGAGTVTINYTLGLPVEPGYTAGQLKPGESVIVYFNVTIN